jgi:hypothetical protein
MVMAKDILIKQKKNLTKKYLKDGARPPRYKCPEDMIYMVDQYVKDGCAISTKIVGRAPNERIIQSRRLSLYGLAIHLGFSSRKQMNNFADRHPEYKDVIQMGKTYVAEFYEGLGQDGVSPTFMNFMLHNIDGLVMSKDDPNSGGTKKRKRIKFSNRNTNSKVRTLDGGSKAG